METCKSVYGKGTFNGALGQYFVPAMVTKLRGSRKKVSLSLLNCQ